MKTAVKNRIFDTVEDLFTRSAFTEFNERFIKYPDTGIEFDGYQIFGAEKVIGAAKRMNTTMPQVGIVSRDFTVDKDGEPLVIEANIRGLDLAVSNAQRHTRVRRRHCRDSSLD